MKNKNVHPGVIKFHFSSVLVKKWSHIAYMEIVYVEKIA